MHIDVNNAFLSWSAVYYLLKGSKKDIRNTVSVIGGDESKRTGIVLAKSPLAKKFNIVTGETLYAARKKYSNLEVYPMNYPFYQEMSNKLFELIKKYTPDVEVASIDECYIDYTKVKKLYGDQLEFAKKIQNQIYEELKFTVNIGIGNNKLCAKMASDFLKPNKIHTLYNYEVEEKMWPLDVFELFGIGKKSYEKLKVLNIKTIKDLALCDPVRLYPYFKNQTASIINSANGINNSEVDSSTYENKGISNELTLVNDVSEISEIEKYVLSLCEKVSRRLRNENKFAYVICVILKNNKFQRRSHQKKLMNPISSSKEIFDISKIILKEMWNDEEQVRLIGIRLDSLCEAQVKQISIFDAPEKNKQEIDLDKVVDELKNKYGNSIIKKTSEVNLYNKKE